MRNCRRRSLVGATAGVIACTRVIGTSRSTRSPAAHRTAASDAADPSTPTTTLEDPVGCGISFTRRPRRLIVGFAGVSSLLARRCRSISGCPASVSLSTLLGRTWYPSNLVVWFVSSSGVVARRWGRRGRARRRNRELLLGFRRMRRWAGSSLRTCRCWRGGSQSPTGWPIRRSATA